MKFRCKENLIYFRKLKYMKFRCKENLMCFIKLKLNVNGMIIKVEKSTLEQLDYFEFKSYDPGSNKIVNDF